ncbi:MAG: phospholipase D-like domain-containing protein [Nannocystaceae bacterium]
MRRATLLLPLTLLACPRGEERETIVPLAGEPEGRIELLLYEPGTRPAPADSCDVPLCSSLLRLIEGAHETVDFAIYGMRNQSQILAALQAAKARGVQVRGVVDRDREGKNYYASTDALVAALGDIGSDQKSDERLAKQRARKDFGGEPQCDRPEGTQGPVQCLAYDLGDSCLLAAHASREKLGDSDAIMHDKFFVVDGEHVWTGSTNVSDSCSGGYNANLVVVAHSRKLAQWYTAEFEQMYRKGFFHTQKVPQGPSRVELGNAEVELRFSPQDDPIRDGVRPLLKHARERIDIAVFFLTHKHIVEDLITAHERGVKVRVVIDATGARNEYSKHELLRAAGIPVKVENWGGKMHMKSAAIDGKVVIAGSMNWTSSGEYNNDENTLLLRSDELATQYHAFFETMWNGLPEALLTANPDPESRSSGTSCSDGVDNDYDGKKDGEDPGCGDDPPPLPALPGWRIVPKGERLTCDVDMGGDAIRRSTDAPAGTAVPAADAEQIAAD